MRTRAGLTVLALLFPVLLAGCSSDEPERKPEEPAAAPQSPPPSQAQPGAQQPPPQQPAPSSDKRDVPDTEKRNERQQPPPKAPAPPSAPAAPKPDPERDKKDPGAVVPPSVVKPEISKPEPARPGEQKPADPAPQKMAIKDVLVLTGAPIGGVRLDHKKHAALAGNTCTACHHPSRAEKPATAPQQACSDCHTKAATAPMKTKYQGAFHNPTAQAGTCIDCHKTESAKAKAAPLKCTDCHKKENK